MKPTKPKTENWEKEFDFIFSKPYRPIILRKCKLCGNKFNFKAGKTGLSYCSACRFEYSKRKKVESLEPNYRYFRENSKRNEIKSFVHSLLQQARQEGREEMIEKVSRIKKKMRGIEIRQWGEVRGVDYPDDAYNRSVKEYNKVIEDVISELKKKEGK